jgi:membrane-bound metal-dependent hydrolase YbcI (DUF457 family)
MFLDFAIAIFITLIFDATFNTGVFPLLYWSLLFSVLIDLDFITHKLSKQQAERGYKHRDLLHYPLIVLSVGFIGIYYVNEILAYTFLVIMFLHFLHDSIAYGRGIKWLFPFSKNSYAFFYLYSRTKQKGLWQWVFVFNESNLDAWDNELQTAPYCDS